jgi:hypothetical protein
VPACPETFVIRELIREIGRLSTQKKPVSSTARRATVLPEPDNPVIIRTREFTFFLSTGFSFPVDFILLTSIRVISRVQ